MKTMQEDDITRFLDEAKKGDYFPLFHTYLTRDADDLNY